MVWDRRDSDGRRGGADEPAVPPAVPPPPAAPPSPPARPPAPPPPSGQPTPPAPPPTTQPAPPPQGGRATEHERSTDPAPADRQPQPTVHLGALPAAPVAGPPLGAPPPPAAPPVVPDPWRAVAVGVLNLSGLGIGYALVRLWWAVAVCWLATAGLLLVALPADPDGVPGGVLLAYGVVLGAAVAHGAFVGRRRLLLWPPRPAVAVLLGVALLAAPAGGVVAYDGARDEATEEMLLDRLEEADRIVARASKQPFPSARDDYRQALSLYTDLTDDHPGSRAARRVPDRLTAYYEAVGAPYARQQYCEAIAPLKFLWTLSPSMKERRLGSVAGWPEDRLATSLYECGTAELGTSTAGTGGTGASGPEDELGDLLTMFPESAQAAKVQPTLRSKIRTAADGLKGADPCASLSTLRTLGAQATAVAEKAGNAPGKVPEGVLGALREDAGAVGGHERTGTFACGVDQYEDGKFDLAIATMNGFADTYHGDKDRPRAQKIAIAAEVAKELPDAGKRLPTTASGGSVTVTVKNDSPNAVDILYTGPVTGKFSLAACDGCTTYASREQARSRACQSGKSYPQRTLTLPVGTTYFLHKSKGTSNESGTDTARIEPGYIYTECAYTVSPFGIGPLD